MRIPNGNPQCRCLRLTMPTRETNERISLLRSFSSVEAPYAGMQLSLPQNLGLQSEMKLEITGTEAEIQDIERVIGSQVTPDAEVLVPRRDRAMYDINQRVVPSMAGWILSEEPVSRPTEFRPLLEFDGLL